jgi:uncharacterized protein
MSDDFRWINIGTNNGQARSTAKRRCCAICWRRCGRGLSRDRGPSRIVSSRAITRSSRRGDNVTKAGKPYNNEYCFVFRLSDGKIREVKEYADTALVDAVLGDPGETLAAE